MGCDIHLFLEWERVGWREGMMFPNDRNYLMFGLMAGVRGHIKLFKAKGLPDKLNHYTRREYRDWQNDAHSESWLTTEEYEKCVNEYKRILKEEWGEEDDNYDKNIYHILLGFMKELERRGMENVRLVFWFDN